MGCSRREFVRTGIIGAVGLLGGSLLLPTQGCEVRDPGVEPTDPRSAERPTEPPEAVDEPEEADPALSVVIDTDRCIGCTLCVEVASDAYRMNPRTNKAELIPDAPGEAIKLGAEACPVDAISW